MWFVPSNVVLESLHKFNNSFSKCLDDKAIIRVFKHNAMKSFYVLPIWITIFLFYVQKVMHLLGLRLVFPNLLDEFKAFFMPQNYGMTWDFTEPSCCLVI